MAQFKRLLQIASIVIDALKFVLEQIEKQAPTTTKILNDDKLKEK